MHGIKYLPHFIVEEGHADINEVGRRGLREQYCILINCRGRDPDALEFGDIDEVGVNSYKPKSRFIG